MGVATVFVIAVLVYLDISELPKSLVLNRWTKNAKEAVQGLYKGKGFIWDSLVASRHANLAHWCKQVMNEGCRKSHLLNTSRDTLISLIAWIKSDNAEDTGIVDHAVESRDHFLREPNYVRTKGCSWGDIKAEAPALSYMSW